MFYAWRATWILKYFYHIKCLRTKRRTRTWRSPRISWTKRAKRRKWWTRRKVGSRVYFMFYHLIYWYHHSYPKWEYKIKIISKVWYIFLKSKLYDNSKKYFSKILGLNPSPIDHHIFWKKHPRKKCQKVDPH